MLDAVDITADYIPIVIKKDTIEYNARAFKTQANASVEELLRKLPGVEVDAEGGVKAQGEDVNKILVDGKEFFGDDPKIATKNLPADAVNKVQVFDKMSELSEVGAATNQFSEKTREATLALSDMKTAYSRATEAMSLLGDVGADTQKYHVEVQNVAKNLGALNAMYEMELQDTNNHLKAMNDFYGNLTNAISAMNDSAADAEKYRDNMMVLNGNLTTLNNVYGNMLAAMSSSGNS